MPKNSKTGRAALGIAFALGSLGAQAGILTMNGWRFGAGHKVAAGTPSHAGAAGGFKGTLTGMTDSKFNLDPVEMYCVDLGQTININAGITYSVLIDGEPGSASFTLKSVGSVFSADIAMHLSQLVSCVASDPSRVNTSARSTSLQLAIWNTVYHSGDTLSDDPTRSTDFKDGSSYMPEANALLANSVGFGITQDLFVLKSAGSQDQLIWIANSVPEPGTLALAGLAIAGAAGLRRRRG